MYKYEIVELIGYNFYIKCNLVWLFKRLNVNISNMQYFMLTYYYQLYNKLNEIIVIMFKKRLYCVETMMIYVQMTEPI